MSWTLGGTRIFVEELSSDVAQIIARIQPLSAGTIHHTFGYETKIYKLKVIVVGPIDLAAVEAMTTTGSMYALLENDESTGGISLDFGDFYVKRVSIRRLSVIKQTIRPDLDCYDPLFEAEVELYL